MTPYWSDDHLTLYGGDCRDVLREPKGSPTNPYLTGRQAAVLAAGVAGAVLVLVWVVSRG